MTIDAKLLARENPSRQSVDRLKRGKSRLNPWRSIATEECAEGTSHTSDVVTTTGHNRAQIDNQQGTTTGHNRAQDKDQQGTTGHNRAQTDNQQGTTTGHNRAQQGTTKSSDVALLHKCYTDVQYFTNVSGEVADQHAVSTSQDDSISSITAFNRAQMQLVPGLSETCARLEKDLCPVETGHNWAQQGTVPGSLAQCARLEQGTTTGHNRAQNTQQQGTTTGHNRAQRTVIQDSLSGPISCKRNIPTGAQQVAILLHLAAAQQAAGLDHTPRIKRRILAETLGISATGIKNQLARLCRGGFLKRLSTRDGRGEAGTVYKVSAAALKALQSEINGAQQQGTTRHKLLINGAQQQGTTGHNNRAQHPISDDVSSSSLKTTTTNLADSSNARAVADQLQTLVDRFNLDNEFKLGANDLLGAQRQAQVDPQDFATSVEHIAFYLRSSEAKSINHPKAWALRQLRLGYYPAPAGFVSWEEAILKAKIEEAETKAERIKKLRIRQFEAEFVGWCAELPAERKTEILRGTLFDCASVGPGVNALLRRAFAQDTARLDLLDDNKPALT